MRPVDSQFIIRAAELHLSWRTRDLHALSAHVASIDTLDKAKDIIIAMALLDRFDDVSLEGIVSFPSR